MNKTDFAYFMEEYLGNNQQYRLGLMVSKGVKREIAPETKEKVIDVHVHKERIPKIKMHMARVISKPFSPITRVNTGK